MLPVPPMKRIFMGREYRGPAKRAQGFWGALSAAAPRALATGPFDKLRVCEKPPLIGEGRAGLVLCWRRGFVLLVGETRGRLA